MAAPPTVATVAGLDQAPNSRETCIGERELFANLIPLDALPSEVYSDRDLCATKRALERRAARLAQRQH